MAKKLKEHEVRELIEDAEGLDEEESTEEEQYKAEVLKLRPGHVMIPADPNFYVFDVLHDDDGRLIRNDRTVSLSDVVSMDAAIRDKGGLTDEPNCVVLKAVGENYEIEDDPKFREIKHLLPALEKGTHKIMPMAGNRRLKAIVGGTVIDQVTGREMKYAGMDPAVREEYFAEGIPLRVHTGLTKTQVRMLYQDHAGTRGLRREDIVRSLVERYNRGGVSWSHIAYVDRDHMRQFQTQDIQETDDKLDEYRRRIADPKLSTAQRNRLISEAEKYAGDKVRNTINIFAHLAFLQKNGFPMALEQYCLNEAGRKADVYLKGKKTELRKLRNFAEAAVKNDRLPMDWPEFRAYWNTLKKEHREKAKAKANGEEKKKADVALPKNEIIAAKREFLGTPGELFLGYASGDRDAKIRIDELKNVLLYPEQEIKMLIKYHSELIGIKKPEEFARRIMELKEETRRKILEGTLTPNGDEE